MRPLNGYPTSIGSERASIMGLAGPTSYTAVTAGATPSGGQTVGAVAFGLKFLDFIVGGETDSGRFFVEAIPVTPTQGAPANSAGTTYRLRWVSRVTASVGGQAQVAYTEAAASTDLSGETVRLLAIGPK
jgi:hypothetical protein